MEREWGVGREWGPGWRRDGTEKTGTETCRWTPCEKPERAAGFCMTHYMRVKHNPDLEEMLDPVYRAERCEIDGCDYPQYAKGLCRKHNERARRQGSPVGLTSRQREMAHKYALGLNPWRVKLAMKMFGVTLDQLADPEDLTRERIRQLVDAGRLAHSSAAVLEEETDLPLSWYEVPEPPRFVRDDE